MADDTALTTRPGMMARAWRSLTGQTARERQRAVERELEEERRRRREAQDAEERQRSRVEAMLAADSFAIDIDGRLYMRGASERDLLRDIPRQADGTPKMYPVSIERSSSRAPGMRRGMITRASPLPPGRGEQMEGGYGTPWLGQVPGVEHRPDLHPYFARGLSTDIGLLRQAATQAVAADTIDAVVDILAGGSVYVRPPKVSEARSQFIVGYDADRMESIAEWVNVQLQLNPSFHFGRMLRELIWCMEVDGFSLHEFTIDPAATQWMLSGVEYRAASSVMEWIYSPEERRIVAFTQTLSSGPAGETQGSPTVDLSRCLHAVNRQIGLNPEGIASTRKMYPWTHGAGIIWQTIMQHRQRFGVGFPVFRVTKDAMQDQRTTESIAAARKFYAAPDAYMQLPVGLDVEMLQIQPDLAGVEIMRYADMMIRRAAGMQHLELGIEGGGSYNLGEKSAEFFLKRMSSRVSAISAAFDQLVRSLVDARFGPQVLYPQLAIDGILTMSATQIMDLWRGMVEVEALGGMTLDERNRMREDAGLPPVDESAETEELDEPGPGEPPPTPAPLTPPEPRASHTSCGHTRARTSRPQVVVHGRDGKPFTTWRQLTEREGVVAWRSLSDGITKGQQSAAISVLDVLYDMRAAFSDYISDAVATGDLGQIAALSERFNVRESKRFVDEIASRMSEQLTTWSDFVEADTLGEIEAMGGEATSQPHDIDLSQFIGATASVKARQVVDEYLQTLTAAAMRGGQTSEPEIVTQVDVSPDTVASAMREPYTQVLNQAREATLAEFGPEIVASQYSAVMDGDTCGQVNDGTMRCADMDGRIMLLDDPDRLATIPPNPKCDSALNLRRGNQCRCIELFLTPEAYAQAMGTF